jgi:hypothetical protein
MIRDNESDFLEEALKEELSLGASLRIVSERKTAATATIMFQPKAKTKRVPMNQSMKDELLIEVELRRKEQVQIEQKMLEDLQRKETKQRILLNSERQKMEQARLERKQRGQTRVSSQRHLARHDNLQKKLEQIRKQLLARRETGSFADTTYRGGQSNIKTAFAA